MTVMTTKEEIVGMKKDISYLKEGQDEMKEDVKHIINKLDKLDNKFAAKWVERAIITVGGTLIVAVLMAATQIL